MVALISLINVLAQLLTLLIIAHVLLSYFISPYHPIRRAIDRLVEPMLTPLRRLIPPVGMLDFSPVVLIILIQLVARLLIGFLVSL